MGVRFSLIAFLAWLSLLLLLAVIGIVRPVSAASPPSGTIAPGDPPVTWSGGPFTGTTSDPVSANCGNSECDDFLLTVTGGDATQYELRVEINWTNPANDLDLYIFNEAGSQLDVDGAAVSNVESVAVPAASGTYRVSVLIYRAVAESYTARATIVATGSVPEPPNQFRTANYHRFDFGFKPEVKLPEQERSTIFIDQDVEPEIEIDRFGTIYIGAIRGIGGGTDFWRSDNGGTSFLYMGEPDGLQNPSPFPPSPEGGVGGGDVDLSLGAPFDVVPAVGGNPAIRSTGRIFCSSLWLGSATMSVSVDRGENWVPFPFTTAQLDRQWHSASGEKTVYMSLRKVSQIELDQNDVFVIQSDDGMTFTKGSYVQDPLSSISDDLAGNSILTQEGFLVGSFVSRDGRDLYVYKSRTAPPTLPLAPTEVSFDPSAFVVDRVFHGAGGLTTNNTFPIMALDKGNNIHLSFSDRSNIYLMSCAAGQDPADSTKWNKPVLLNAPKVAGFEFATTSLFPWITGGDAGIVVCLWYGTHVVGDADSPIFEEQAVPWKIVYAQVENALGATPDVYLDIASKQGQDGVIHTGQICTRGLGCPDGTRELAEYSSLTVDNDGFANIAYTGTVINGVDPRSTGAITFFTKSTVRPARQGETLVKLECHDSRITREGGWHDIEDARATNGSYCRNVGANDTNGGAYLQFQFEGTSVDLQIARGPRGGNAEVLIDGVSRGRVDFWRAASDPAHPDNSGRKDLTFGEFVSFATSSGSHTFRLEVRNDSPDGKRDIVYVDGLVIHDGSSTGQGNPTESSTTVQGTVPAGTPLAPGVSTQTITASAATSLLTGVLEMTDGADLDLVLLDPAGAVLATAATTSPTEVTRRDPGPPGVYTFIVKNKGPASEYRLSGVRTEDGGGALAAALPHGETHAAKAGTGPFDPSGKIAYSVASAGRVLIRVFSANGRLVRTLFDQVAGPGRHITRWNGRSEDGAKLPSGVYLFRVQHPDGDLSTVKTVLLR
ncbi:MAG TPA: FlgD immunoglobulin-like domain containing protein [Candidatus Eisenbacteria bacterium]|jgi:hypothetical protein